MQNHWSSLFSLFLCCALNGCLGRNRSNLLLRLLKPLTKIQNRFQVKFFYGVLHGWWCSLRLPRPWWLTKTEVRPDKCLTWILTSVLSCPLKSSPQYPAPLFICLSFHSECVYANVVWRLTVTCWLTWAAAMACRLLELLLLFSPTAMERTANSCTGVS